MRTPTVALTFDDGPSEWTEQLLDLFAERLCRATFFVLGCHIAGREETLARAVSEGHELGVHGWDHVRLPSITRREFVAGLRRTSDELTHVTGARPVLWRAPWHCVPAIYALAATRAGYRYAGVTVDGYDVSTSEGTILARVIPGLGDGAVVGLHDGIAPNGEQQVQTRDATVRATAKLLDRCMSVTVSELRAKVAA